ncbi:divinylchlorophyllide 8-vinylreductase [Roseovarius azorensis]|uniref:Divinyl chlorophyllide a 8-vinyl-reductase, chloroplastic n=1 Tax=Roseovarius azorensis TaxID=1287727 RepID=A0A1H7UG30_9RHOB|nr:NAD(P)H-binding protein [Roseovarius azorensis]SEL95769.1 divinylchlorophyllide 8-vinylreductase [Roseovarius azorensis]
MQAAEARRVLLLGATGTIGRAVLTGLRVRGHAVTCLTRPPGGALPQSAALDRVMARGRFDAVLSCMASRSGAPDDARAVDHDAHLAVLRAAQAAGVWQFVLLSAICVQKPLLTFQQAKLDFEAALMTSGLCWSIVRPTAYFKSLSGQIARVRAGRPYLIFGDGRGTACKPISDGDLAAYLVECLHREDRWNRVLPIGGPGPAITPREMGEELFRLTGQAPRFRSVPPGLMDAIVAGLSLAGRVSGRLAAKAELARIGRYYSTESMLVWDAAAGRYDAAATPETGSERLFDYYAAVLRGEASAERGEHAVF